MNSISQPRESLTKKVIRNVVQLQWSKHNVTFSSVIIAALRTNHYFHSMQIVLSQPLDPLHAHRQQETALYHSQFPVSPARNKKKTNNKLIAIPTPHLCNLPMPSY